jgi:hypothetical protein
MGEARQEERDLDVIDCLGEERRGRRRRIAGSEENVLWWAVGDA